MKILDFRSGYERVNVLGATIHEQREVTMKSLGQPFEDDPTNNKFWEQFLNSSNKGI